MAKVHLKKDNKGGTMSQSKPKILILFYTMYGHILSMSKAVAEGVKEAGGDPVLKRVEELIPEEYCNAEMLRVRKLCEAIPVANPHMDLENIDGIIVGTPTRFGNMTAQMRNFWDQTGAAWTQGALVGKPASVFTSTNTQHGGQETTIITTMISLLHHGCVLVGLPYSFTEQLTTDEIAGGSPYGASTIAGSEGKRQPSEKELAMAKHLGSHLTGIAKKLTS